MSDHLQLSCFIIGEERCGFTFDLIGMAVSLLNILDPIKGMRVCLRTAMVGEYMGNRHIGRFCPSEVLRGSNAFRLQITAKVFPYSFP